MLTLHADSFWISPYAFSCFVGLREKGLDFEMKPVSLVEKAQKRPEYAQKSITARIPALDHDGFWVAESSAIVEYLDEAFPAPNYPRLLPENGHDRARARQLMSWIRSDDMIQVREERPTTAIFYEPAKTKLTERGRAAANKLMEVADRVVREGQANLFGAWCNADADLAFILHRLILSNDDVPAKLKAYAQGQWRRPSVVAFVTHRRPPYVPYG